MGAVFRYNGGPWAEVGSRIGDRTAQVGMQIANQEAEAWGSVVRSIGAGITSGVAAAKENIKEKDAQEKLKQEQFQMPSPQIVNPPDETGGTGDGGTASIGGQNAKQTYDMSAIGDINARMQYDASLSKQKAADSLSLTLPFTPLQRDPFV